MTKSPAVTADVVVVGGGIAGVSAAYELAGECRVLLVEAEGQLAYHTTGRSAAVFLQSYGVAQFRRLTIASRAMFEEGGPDSDMSLFTPRGLLWVATDKQVPQLAALVAASTAEGNTLASISTEEAHQHCSVLRPDYLAAAAFEPDAQDIDVAGLHQAYLRAARRRGLVIRTATRVRSARRTAAGFVLETTSGAIESPVVVNAAGPWADALAARMGAARVGLTPLRRTLAVARASTMDGRWPFVASVADDWYFRPEGPNLLICPADETPDVPHDVRPDELDVALALERVNAATTLELRSVVTSWAGLRTFAPDRAPVIGFDADVPGLFWLAGQGGYGIQSAPAAARLTASCILGQSIPPELEAAGVDVPGLSPARFQ